MRNPPRDREREADRQTGRQAEREKEREGEGREGDGGAEQGQARRICSYSSQVTEAGAPYVRQELL